MKKSKELFACLSLTLIITYNSSATDIYRAISTQEIPDYSIPQFEKPENLQKLCSKKFGYCIGENVSLLIQEEELANLPARILDIQNNFDSDQELFKIALPDGSIKEKIPGGDLCGSKEICINDEVLIKGFNNDSNSDFYILSKIKGIENSQLNTKTIKIFEDQNHHENVSNLTINTEKVSKSVMCLKEFCFGNEKYKQFEAMETGWKILRLFDNETIEIMVHSNSYLISLDLFMKTIFGRNTVWGSNTPLKTEDLLNLRSLPLYYNSMADRIRDERVMLLASEKTKRLHRRQQIAQTNRSMKLIHQQSADFFRSMSSRGNLINEGRKIRLEENRQGQKYQLNSIEFYEREALARIREESLTVANDLSARKNLLKSDIYKINRSYR
ncbi:MAG: hypothetical protein J0M15_04690 [Deltaproteobacteria bacterium]|jgi:hypothetical protein|nr:hypothetical protein [Deltaproteobacteria bacterium]